MGKFDYRDWDIEPEIDVGNDDFIFGHYVDWDSFRENYEEELLESFDINLPWGKELQISEYIEFINQEVFMETSIIEDFYLDKLDIVNEASDLSKIIVQFPNRMAPNSVEVVYEIFDYFGVPSGIEYEYELPEDLQYWERMLQQDYDEDEYESYKDYPFEFRTYEGKILDIKSKVSNSFDVVIKKSLILSSFIISESLLKSVIVSKIPDDKTISEFSKNILSKAINNRLLGSVEKRNSLFKDLFKKKAPKQVWTDLRNSLAHDIEASTIQHNQITYRSLKEDKEYTVSIDELFDQQIIFFNELQKIIDEK